MLRQPIGHHLLGGFVVFRFNHLCLLLRTHCQCTEIVVRHLGRNVSTQKRPWAV